MSKERAMRRTLIRYKAKPELADRNAELVSAVFAELKAAGPDGVRYLTLRLELDTFIHLVEAAAEDGSSPIPKLRAFQAFQDGIRDRCAEALLAQMRPKLHRYCARMVGSVIDGEDVLQDALIKAMGALQSVTPAVNTEGWLFR